MRENSVLQKGEQGEFELFLRVGVVNLVLTYPFLKEQGDVLVGRVALEDELGQNLGVGLVEVEGLARKLIILGEGGGDGGLAAVARVVHVVIEQKQVNVLQRDLFPHELEAHALQDLPDLHALPFLRTYGCSSCRTMRAESVRLRCVREVGRLLSGRFLKLLLLLSPFMLTRGSFGDSGCSSSTASYFSRQS